MPAALSRMQHLGQLQLPFMSGQSGTGAFSVPQGSWSASFALTRSIYNFRNGVYLLWNVTGDLKLWITRTAGNNSLKWKNPRTLCAILSQFLLKYLAFE